VQFTRFCVLDLGLKIESAQTGPYFLQTGPWNENCNRNVVPGAMPCGQSSIPAKGGLGPVGKVRGRHKGSPGVRFQGSIGAEERPKMMFGGAMDLRPPVLLFRRGGRS
jgi:hypothetical protein